MPDVRNTIDTPAPHVFVSYSHDSPEHRRWVLNFANTLVEKGGINVMLDQWDIGPGHDLPRYMERSVAQADRVILVCTEKYVAKANDGTGGAGYEAMVVSGELMRDLGTAKFIPIVRQASKTILPRALSTRFYVNFGEGQDEAAAYEQLFREIHRAPAAVKPQIGANPFALTPSGEEIAAELATDGRSDAKAIARLSDPVEVFDHASKIIRADDTWQWRKAVSAARSNAVERLAAWRTAYVSIPPQDLKLLAAESMEGVVSFSGLFALMLAAIASGREGFSNQTGLLEDVLDPSGWDRSGYVVRTDLPRAAGFVYQALHGAMAMHVRKPRVALELTRTDHRLPNSRDVLPLWQHSDIMGWPESLGRNTSHTWTVLAELDGYMPWVSEMFGAAEDWKVALTAYYMALNVNEFASVVAKDPSTIESHNRLHLSIPLAFAAMPDHVTRRAMSLLSEDSSFLDWIFSSAGTTRGKASPHWDAWVRLCNGWLGQLYPFAFQGIPHASLL